MSDMNQNTFTTFPRVEPLLVYENPTMVAVTPEKNVATVERFCSLAISCSCAMRIDGTPESRQ
jgi:hypothetical protein